MPYDTLEQVTAIEGMVTIGLDVQLSALGSALETRIAGYGVELRLPRPPLMEDGIGLSGGELTAPAFQHFEDGEKLRDWMEIPSSHAWGNCYMRDPDGGGAAWVGRCALVVPLAEGQPSVRPQEIAAAIFQEVDLWRSVVLDWLETAHSQLVRSNPPPKIGDAIDPWLWSHDGQKRVVHYNNPPLRAYVSVGETALDASSLQRVLHRAGELDRPPLAWRLTRDAQRQHMAGDHRRAVFDAGTAAELALSKAFPRRKTLGKDRRSLTELVRKAEEVTSGLRVGDAETALVDVRNAAAHDAEEPSDSVAARALRISAQYVEAAWPRAELLTAKTGG